MKTGLLEKLIDAGFSKDEIMQLARDEPEPVKDQPALEEPKNPEPENIQEQPAQPAQEEPKPQDSGISETVTKMGDRLTGIEQKFTDLLKAIQNQNLRNDFIQSAGDDLDTQTDNIMKSIIRPEIKKE